MYLTCAESRELDRRATEEFGIPSIVLMENAGRNMAELLVLLGVRGSVVVCCGKGNNGGDGFVIARHLDIRRVPVQVLLFCPPEELTGDAATNCRIVQKAAIPLTVPPATLEDQTLRGLLLGAEWIVDALFGSGLRGPVRSPFDRVIEVMNSSLARILAVDVPSGLDSDTGQPLGATIRGQHTATVVAPKQGFASPASRAWTGEVHVIDIGLPRALFRASPSSRGEPSLGEPEHSEKHQPGQSDH
jgi:NAD(P)H-hydrate epimerase